MLGLAIGAGANVFIIIVVLLIAFVTGISVTDILKTKDKPEEN